MSFVLVKNLGGKDRGLRFIQGAVDTYWQQLNYTELGASAVYAIFYCGLIGECIVNSEQADFTKADVCEWLDKMYADGREEEIKTVCDLFAELDSYKKSLAKLADKLKTLNQEAVEDNTKIKKKRT